MQEPCTAYGIGSYNRLTDNLAVTWTDFDISGKLNLGDSWTSIETGLSLSNPGGSDYWKDASLSGGEAGPYRYWRVDINSTANASNHLNVYEVCLLGQTVV